MTLKNLKKTFVVLITLAVKTLSAQVPVADFTISPGPACAGPGNIIQLTDLSTGSPTAWSYTLNGPGPGNNFITQNPTLTVNGQGIYTITLIASNASGAGAAVSHTLQVLQSPNFQVNPQNQNTCVGGAITTLSALAGPGGASLSFSWSTGATTSTLSVSPAITTVYTCVATSTDGCTSTRTATINVGPQTVTISSVPYSICPGSTSTLSAGGNGGGPFTFTWSTGANTRTTTSSVAGVFNVTVTNAAGCTGTQSFTLGTSSTLSLTATSNSTLLCAGNTATLRATGASSYSWSSGAATPNTTVSPSSSTTYTVDGVLGTCTGSTTITLSVNTTPTIVPAGTPSSFCSGASATLSASGASSYTWIPGGTGQSITVSPSVNITYTVRGSNAPCPVRNATIALTVLPAPVLLATSNVSLSCAGENVALAASGASTYSWSTGNNSAVIIVSPVATTVYTVTGISSNNCKASAVITQSVAECTGLTGNTREAATLDIFPNPGTGVFTIVFSVDVTLTLMNAQGNVTRKNIAVKKNSETTIDLEDLPAGIYILAGTADQGLITRKIVVCD